MKVFISWSGPRSQLLAEALQEWLPLLFQTIEPWVSSSDIRAGSRWALDLAQILNEIQFGILCLTKDNINSPWVLFEAGALSKSLEVGRVVPYLLDISPSELPGPLSQFQAVIADEKGTRHLVQSLAESSVVNLRPERSLIDIFKMAWPRLKGRIERIRQLPADAVKSDSIHSTAGETLEEPNKKNYVIKEVAHNISFEHAGPAQFLRVTDFPELLEIPTGKEVTRFEVTLSVKRQTRAKKGKRELEFEYHTHYAPPPKYIPYGEHLPILADKARKWERLKFVAVHKGIDTAWLCYHAEGDEADLEIIRIKNIRTMTRIESKSNA